MSKEEHMNLPAPTKCPECGLTEVTISCRLCGTSKIKDTTAVEQPFDFFKEIDRVAKILYPKG